MELRQFSSDRLLPRAACRVKHAAMQRGFTLVELLVTCALVTVLMLACAQVFSIASKTIGGGQALGAAVRDAQSAQAVFARDLAAAAPATVSPVFYLVSDRIYAYRNANDARVDGSVDSFDFDDDGTETTIPQATYNFRNHRIDTLGFFTIDKYTRQTGGGANLVISDASREAWVWYGHLNLANNSGVADNTTRPGVGTSSSNPNNYFATQWTLGRVAVLMKDPATINGGSAYSIARNAGDLAPLAFSKADDSANTALLNFQFDVGAATMATFRQDVINATAPLTHMIYEDGNALVGRIRANPFQIRPLNPARAAQQVPIFVPGCTQFIVEFAGDFVAQDGPTPGAVYDKNGDNDFTNDTDGRVDYVTATGQIRWYGMPRDTNADGRIRSVDGDVTPIRDLIAGGTKAKPDFERVLPTASIPTATAGYADVNTTLSRYIAAWGPTDINRPKMIRITLVIDRPEAEGKLLDGQSFEYVFNVGY